LKKVLCVLVFIGILLSPAWAEEQQEYLKKLKRVQMMDLSIEEGVDYICQHLAVDKSTICRNQNNLQTSLRFEKMILDGLEDLDDVDEEKLGTKVTNVELSYQYYEALVDVIGFYNFREKAGQHAEKQEWLKAYESILLAENLLVKAKIYLSLTKILIERN